MRWLIILGLLLTLLAWLQPASQTPRLDWLAGSWHDPEHESTRLIFSKPGDRGVTGLLTTESDTTVLAIDPNGELTLRQLGACLSQNNPVQQLHLLERSARQLRYNHVSLRHLNARTESCELQLELNGRTLRLQPD
jgi:hypothetical protein